MYIDCLYVCTVMPETRTLGGGGYDSILPTGGECPNLTEYCKLNKYKLASCIQSVILFSVSRLDLTDLYLLTPSIIGRWGTYPSPCRGAPVCTFRQLIIYFINAIKCILLLNIEKI